MPNYYPGLTGIPTQPFSPTTTAPAAPTVAAQISSDEVLIAGLRSLTAGSSASPAADGAVPASTPRPTSEPSSASGFKKFDEGKPRFGLIPPAALLEIARVFTHGAEKYGAGNYLKGADWSRYYDAAQRHLNAWARREDNDPETGISHLAHAASCLLILRALQLLERGSDNR